MHLDAVSIGRDPPREVNVIVGLVAVPPQTPP